MPLQHLQLQLIRQVLQTEDAEALETALRVLKLSDKTATAPPPPSGDVPGVLQQGKPPTDKEVQDLQKDIDEIFGQ